MHGGVKFYRGSATAARSYVEADQGRADDYYLAEGTGLADRLLALNADGSAQVSEGGTLDGDAYEAWVGGYRDDGTTKGRLRTDNQALRFVEVVVNGPKTWSLAAAVNPEIAAAYDQAQDRAAREVVGWLAEHATTRIGPRGRQVQVPVEQLEAAVVRHHTSRAGDPHRHLHLQINARVFAAGRWRGLHSVGVVDSIEAINGIGHAAIATDPQFRQALADHGYTLHPDNLEVDQLLPYAPGFSARAAQISRNIDRFEAAWRTDHPGQDPGPKLRQTWDRRAWATARPDKITPTNGTDLTQRWLDDLTDSGFRPPRRRAPSTVATALGGAGAGSVDRDAASELVLIKLGGRRSAWNPADIRGQVERLVATLGVVTAPAARRELAEDITARALALCAPLLDRADLPAHIRSLTSTHVMAVEADLVTRIATRVRHHGLDGLDLLAQIDAPPTSPGTTAASSSSSTASTGSGNELGEQQRLVAVALAGTHPLLVIEGAAGAGKTTTLAAARALVEADWRRLVVVTPTLKSAQVASNELGTEAFSAAWLVHQHGYRWDVDNRWARVAATPSPRAVLDAGDVLLVDEAGMLDQDTALALLAIADTAGAQVALVGDRHQLPAVGRGGVLDLAVRWAPPHARLELDTVRRFDDPEYAALSLLMRTGEQPGEVFDALLARGEVVIHPSQVQRTATVATQGGEEALVIADTREQVRELNAALRDERHRRSGAVHSGPSTSRFLTAGGELISAGDMVCTRRNDPALSVSNRDRWVVTTIDQDTLTVTGRLGTRILPNAYAHQHLELAYATTAHGAQGDTTDVAHFVVGDTTGSASAYVAMTRGRHRNTAHLVAETTDEARALWIAVFSRDRADLGPTHAKQTALQDLDRYGPATPTLAGGLSNPKTSTPELEGPRRSQPGLSR